MGALAGIVDWRPRDDRETAVEGMMALVPHRGAPRFHRTSRAALAESRATGRAERGKAEGRAAQPRDLTLVADLQLYRRDALAARLGSPPAGDRDLLGRAYRRWGDDLVHHLDGDFAFALWHEERGRLFAARDPFGLRPLFYASSGGRFAFATEPKQLLALPEVSREVDPLIVGECLFGRFEEIARTFHRAVARLPAGHRLWADAEGVRVERYWWPRVDPAHAPGSREEALTGFRRGLRQAVAERVAERPRATFVQLSGGLDSSAVTVLAGDLARTGERPAPQAALSAVFPGLDCDETPLIAETAKNLPFPSLRHNALVVPDLEAAARDCQALDSPFVDLQGAMLRQAAAEMADARRPILLTGMGGDELTHEESILRDLAASGRGLRLLRETWASRRLSHASFRALLVDALRGGAPESWKRVYRRLRNRPWRAPEWATEELVSSFVAGRQMPDDPLGEAPSRVQADLLRNLRSAPVAWALEALEGRAASLGLEVRHPFYDRPLAERVLAIPWTMRLTGGSWKALLRRGLAADLPEPVLRAKKVHFTSYDRWLLESLEADIRALFASSTWASSPWVDQRRARQRVEETFTDLEQADWPRLVEIWRLTTLELWLRGD